MARLKNETYLEWTNLLTTRQNYRNEKALISFKGSKILYFHVCFTSRGSKENTSSHKVDHVIKCRNIFLKQTTILKYTHIHIANAFPCNWESMNDDIMSETINKSGSWRYILGYFSPFVAACQILHYFYCLLPLVRAQANLNREGKMFFFSENGAFAQKYL